jgi:hypothetical protein
MSEWIERILGRKLISQKDEEVNLWQLSDKLPFEVGDLVHFPLCHFFLCTK